MDFLITMGYFVVHCDGLETAVDFCWTRSRQMESHGRLWCRERTAFFARSWLSSPWKNKCPCLYSLCLSLSLSIYLSFFLSFFLIYRSIYPSIYLSIYLSICTIVYYALIHILIIYICIYIYIYIYIIYKGMIVAWGFGVVAIYFLVVQFKYDGLD